MYECINPTQYVKEHENDYLVIKGGRFYVHTVYAGLVEIKEKDFERLESKGMKVI